MYNWTVSFSLSIFLSLSFISHCSVCRQQAEIENSKYIQWYCHYARCWHAYRMRSEFSSILHANTHTQRERGRERDREICICLHTYTQPHKHLTARRANKHSIIAYFCASSSQNGVALFAPSQQKLSQMPLLFFPLFSALYTLLKHPVQAERERIWFDVAFYKVICGVFCSAIIYSNIKSFYVL